MVTDGEALVLGAAAGREAVAARALSPRSPNVLHGCRVSRALELIEFADDHPALSDTGSSGNALGARVALRLKTARGAAAAAKPSAAAVAALQMSPGKRKRAHSLAAGAGVALGGGSMTAAKTPPAGSADKQLRARLLERRMDPTPRAAVAGPLMAKPKDKKKRRVDVMDAALERFRSEEAPALARCVAFSSRFCPPTRATHSSNSSSNSDSRAADSDDEVDGTDGESCPVDELGRSPSAKAEPARRGRLRVQVGVALAQGARAYMEDRYSVVENLFEDETIQSLDDDEMMLDGHDPASGLPLVTTTSPSLLAIYDGHNGAFAADYARDRFRELLAESELLREVNRRARRGPMAAEDVAKVRGLLVGAFATVDEEIVTRTLRMGKRDGSTVLLGLLVGGKLFVANVGDSRGVLSRGASGELAEAEDDAADAVRVSVDHKPDCAKETARIEAAGGKVVFSGCWRVAHDRVPLRLAISRSLGDHPLKVGLPASCSGPLVSVEPDVAVVDVASAQGELMVFASDGLWDRLSDHDAVRLARAKAAEFDAAEAAEDAGAGDGPSAEALRFAATALVEDALAKRSMDNITAMVVSWSAMP